MYVLSQWSIVAVNIHQNDDKEIRPIPTPSGEAMDELDIVTGISQKAQGSS
jgi:hypothetical protein